MIGFGGPEQSKEILPFLKRVVRGKGIPEQRLKSVEAHYLEVGGVSPYNEQSRLLLEALEDKLTEEGVRLPVFLGMRNWHPELELALKKIKEKGLKRGLAIILSPFRSEVSFDNYVEALSSVQKKQKCEFIEYVFMKEWSAEELFIQAHIDTIRSLIAANQLEDVKESTELVFTAHSIPEKVAKASSYASDFRKAASDIANGLAWQNWNIAYQSRSGNPREPWLGPDIQEWTGYLKEMGTQAVVCVPIGFLLSNVEVLFDLDIETKDLCKELGLSYYRSESVALTEAFVQLLFNRIQEQLALAPA